MGSGEEMKELLEEVNNNPDTDWNLYLLLI